MADAQAKSLAPLLILRILEHYSDAEHPLTQERIAEIMDENYQVQMERKAISKHLRHLEEMEDISLLRTRVKNPENDTYSTGVYLAERTFSDFELRLIIDSLSGSSFLSEWETNDLIQRVAGLSSRYFQSSIFRYLSMGDRGKTENETVIYSLEEIDRAVREKKKICFDRLVTDRAGNDKVVTNRLPVTPIQTLVKGSQYYLVYLIYHKPGKALRGGYRVSSHRIDRIANVRVLKEHADSLENIPEFANGIDYDKLLREHPELDFRSDTAQLCTFHCERSMLKEIKAHFGSDVRVAPLNEDIPMLEVSVVTTPAAAVDFAWTHPDGVWLISPQQANTALRFRLQRQLKAYSRLQQKYGAGLSEDVRKRQQELDAILLTDPKTNQ